MVDRTALVVTHLAELVRRRAGRLLSRTDVKALLEGVDATAPAVTTDLSAAQLGPADVQRVLSALLDDSIAIRDLVRILEAISERARINRTPDALVEAARLALGPAISASLAVRSDLAAGPTGDVAAAPATTVPGPIRTGLPDVELSPGLTTEASVPSATFAVIPGEDGPTGDTFTEVEQLVLGRVAGTGMAGR